MFDLDYCIGTKREYQRIRAKAKARPRIGRTAQNIEGETSTDGD